MKGGSDRTKMASYGMSWKTLPIGLWYQISLGWGWKEEGIGKPVTGPEGCWKAIATSCWKSDKNEKLEGSHEKRKARAVSFKRQISESVSIISHSENN